MLKLKLQPFGHLTQRTDALEKILDDGKDWRQEEKRTTEDEMIGWHHQLEGHEFEQALGDGEGQGSLVCCSTWDHKESDTTELNWMGFPDGASHKEVPCQGRRHKGCMFILWVGKIPWRRAWRLIPVFLPGKLHGQRSLLATVHWVTQVALVVKKPPINAGDAGLILALGRFLWRRK